MRYKKYIVKQGDNLQIVSQSQLGDISRWREVATLNNLSHPYITEDPMMRALGAKVAVVGDSILLPIQDNLSAISQKQLNSNSKRTIEELSLGRDFSFIGDLNYATKFGTMDEVLELSDNGRGSVNIVRGIDNMKQAIIHRLLTKRGTLPLHPEYGSLLHEYIGKRLTLEVGTQVSLEMENTIVHDPRVSKTKQNSFYLDTNAKTLTIGISITLIDFETSFNIVVGMDSDGNISLT